MYQPALRPDQVRALYFLKLKRKRLMTVLLREAVDAYFQALGGTGAIIPDDLASAERLALGPSRARPQSASNGLTTPRPPRFKTWV